MDTLTLFSFPLGVLFGFLQKKVASSSSDALRREKDELQGRVAELQEELASLVASPFVFLFVLFLLFPLLPACAISLIFMVLEKKTQKEDVGQKSQLQERIPELEGQLREAEVSFLCPLTVFSRAQKMHTLSLLQETLHCEKASNGQLQQRVAELEVQLREAEVLAFCHSRFCLLRLFFSQQRTQSLDAGKAPV